MYLFLCIINFQIDCIEKVEHVVRIKQKQEEDKAAVKLHSFKLVLLIFSDYSILYIRSDFMYLVFVQSCFQDQWSCT